MYRRIRAFALTGAQSFLSILFFDSMVRRGFLVFEDVKDHFLRVRLELKMLGVSHVNR